MPITLDAIGAFTFIELEGDLDVSGTELEEITRPGADLRAFRKLGQRGAISELRGIARATGYPSYKALQSTVVSGTLRGESFTNYLVIEVMVTDRKQLLSAIGVGSGLILVESRWLLTKAA